MTTDVSALARVIDHTLLRPEATVADIERLCAEAREHGFATVCVNPSFIALCGELLGGSGIPVCSVVGFPFGATSTTAKVREAECAIDDGAREVDVVLHVGYLRSGDENAVFEDLEPVVRTAQARGALVKVTLETCLLTDDQKRLGCALARRAGANFVKTCTGFSTGGVTVEDVTLIRAAVGDSMGVKASGGIRTLQQALALVAAGATRLGTSQSLRIISGGAE